MVQFNITYCRHCIASEQVSKPFNPFTPTAEEGEELTALKVESPMFHTSSSQTEGTEGARGIALAKFKALDEYKSSCNGKVTIEFDLETKVVTVVESSPYEHVCKNLFKHACQPGMQKGRQVRATSPLAGTAVDPKKV